MRLTVVALAAALSVPVAAGPALAHEAGQQQRYVVQFAAGTSPADGARAVRAQGGNVERVLENVFAGSVALLNDRAAAALARNPRVAVVEADSVVRTAATQGSAPWGLDRIDQRVLPLSGAFTWNASGLGVTAYVVDTGVRADHTDFQGRVTTGYTAIKDGRGSNDCHGHGTHVAGTVGARTYGVAKDVRLVPVRVLDCDGAGTMSGVVAGLDWIIAQHTTGTPAVANMSLSGAASSSLDKAIQSTVDDGVSVVVAAGNSNADACTTSPGRVAAAVTVGATDKTDTRASFSNYGTCLDLFAPGVGVVSTSASSTTATATMSGTSMASPHVAGAVAALLQVNPTLSPAAVAERIATTATTGAVSKAGSGSPNRLLWADPVLTVLEAPTVTEPTEETTTTVKSPKNNRGSKATWTKTGA